MSPSAIEHMSTSTSVSIHFMEDFAEGSWFACLQNPTRASIEAKRSSIKAQIRRMEFSLAMKRTSG